MTAIAHSTAPRLAPIDRPRGLLLRLFNWLFRRRLGKVMTPARVIYARLPSILWRNLPLFHLLQRGLALEPELRHLLEVRVSILNGCSFCADLHQADAMLARISDAKLQAALSGEANTLNVRERAALRYVAEIAQGGGVSDACFEALRGAFSEREIVEITWLQAFVTYLNRMAVPLGIGSDGFCALQRGAGASR
jgi:AhpD family alkylhydroperoxidase